LLGFFKARAIPGVESVAGCTYLRSICIDESVGIIQVTISQDHPHVLLEVPIHLAAYLNRIVERIRRMFDLEADPAFIEKHLGHDPRLAELIGKHPGLRVPGVWDGFELGVRAILGQQVSVRAANTLAGRLVAAYGKPFDGMSREDVTWLFPTPDRLCVAELEHIGLPGKRADAVRSLARAVRDGVLTFESRSDLDTLIQELTRLPGIGPWTANYIAMRAFGEPDAFPAGDLVLRKKMTLEGEQTLSEKGALEQAESWRPWRAYAAMYLWHE
jgi:AraC family transcriptional regulator of adaptative response / DNA-3-methyladenine glycosylase II